ncbi:hypothetical protein GCM10007925_25130 [Sphingomonas astaxanthinifaciens DSM 22298]|uniref:Propionyl-coenzyme A carboxylase alpha polypeptide n=3 Tax=Pseudomonadota TaxID=1224 RepID=A0ABQ6BDF3_9BRAD|nr:hypothetical protein GCM10007907_41620 [Chitinimonas prasina]GLR48788.1 hypothetical protein GCM10007925_25130 [Sphingomonas astaxanthinifaciens DSM 22298]GLR92375.1 hypothetical protein GCM10007857_91040 [Bradyrhizobium iriomotense]
MRARSLYRARGEVTGGLTLPWTPIRSTEALERPCPRVKRKPRAGLRGTGENEKTVCTL